MPTIIPKGKDEKFRGWFAVLVRHWLLFDGLDGFYVVFLGARREADIFNGGGFLCSRVTICLSPLTLGGRGGFRSVYRQRLAPS